VHWREVITIDVRPPGSADPIALDVAVPFFAAEGERARRMLASAARSGLGDNTQVHGLGDMGSGLAASFEEAFVGYRAKWSADWKHTSDYITEASKVLQTIDTEDWRTHMTEAVWSRDRQRRDTLVATAEEHRVSTLPTGLGKCPVHAVKTYLSNNWRHMLFAERKNSGLPIVSARAEAQVRDRTKNRFSVAGAWRVENVEGKAALRSIIADGRWERFKDAQIEASQTRYEKGLRQRLERAVEQGRLTTAAVSGWFEESRPDEVGKDEKRKRAA
jgi:hypothetical protein